MKQPSVWIQWSLILAVLVWVMLWAMGPLRLTQHRLEFSAAFMLSDPFLQLPTADSVRVVWFTESRGTEHWVNYGDDLQHRVDAVTTQLSRTREDRHSKLMPDQQSLVDPEESSDRPWQFREVWRHEAIVNGLTPGQRFPYQVTSRGEMPDQGQDKIRGDRPSTVATQRSKVFTLASQPLPGAASKILLTSDHQLMPMTAANLQKVVETIGPVDAVFFAGDLVNVPDRASEWFDDRRGGAFFPCLQGRANYALVKNQRRTVYQGGEIIQHAPLFPAIGNHEVMGRYSTQADLNAQFSDAVPRLHAQKAYNQVIAQTNPPAAPESKQAWMKDHSFNTDTYEEIFSLPEDSPGGQHYYAVSFGDIRLVVLYVTNIWRSSQVAPTIRGRYQERVADVDDPSQWGYGQHIFEAITKDSPQYNWLVQELNSESFQQAKYKVVMFHHPPHTLGGNIVPPYTDPKARLITDENNQVKERRYDYPPEQDYIVRDLLPVLESAGVQLVYYGHSHLWNRFVGPTGIHFLESSNVGNSYGAHLADNPRPVPTDTAIHYAATGNPNGLAAQIPAMAPLLNQMGHPLPYIASNDITVFSILDTGEGMVRSYRFDTRSPEVGVIKFDEFRLDAQ